MTKQYLFIAIEGVDGIGKTTIAQKLAGELNAIYSKTPPPSLKWIARILDKFHNPEIETIGYTFLVIWTSVIIRQRLKSCPVICDKYILTTIVDQSCLKGKLVKMIEDLRYKFVQKPDYTFCLTISDKNELTERLKKRGKLDKNDRQLLPHWSKIQEKYQKLTEVTTIDTTHKTPEEILSIILRYL